jgi:hypothetical protein
MSGQRTRQIGSIVPSFEAICAQIAHSVSSCNVVKHINALTNVSLAFEMILRHTINYFISMFPQGISRVRITLMEYLKIYRSSRRTAIHGLLSQQRTQLHEFQERYVSETLVSRLVGSLTP